jgi:cytochrome c-type biogenesis protein CcmH/NrfG
VPGNWQRLGEALDATGDYAGAIVAFETAVELLPTVMAPHQALARLYYMAGRVDDARREADVLRRFRVPLPASLQEALARDGAAL